MSRKVHQLMWNTDDLDRIAVNAIENQMLAFGKAEVSFIDI